MDIVVKKFPYRYMEYEKAMMKREIVTMFPHAIPMLDQRESVITNLREEDLASLYWLTFIREYKIGNEWYDAANEFHIMQLFKSNSRKRT